MSRKSNDYCLDESQSIKQEIKKVIESTRQALQCHGGDQQCFPGENDDKSQHKSKVTIKKEDRNDKMSELTKTTK